MYLAARDSPSCGVAILQLSRNKLFFWALFFLSFSNTTVQYVSSRSQKQNIRQRFVRGAWHVFWHIIIQSHFCQSHKTLSIFLSTLFFLPLIKNFLFRFPKLNILVQSIAARVSVRHSFAILNGQKRSAPFLC